jgi:AcrR family transcriptional regulator
MPSQRDRILEASLALMARGGAHGTSMRAVASACGLNVATLYHYFPSKRDLLRAAIAHRRAADLPSSTTSSSG